MVPKRVVAYSAKHYVVACEGRGVCAKLFQIGFTKSDASLFVTFPYYSGGHGSLGQVVLSPEMKYPGDLIVGESFSVTSHNVKYSHHPSGRAHFSLTGKVNTSVGKDAVPLNCTDGHIFTVMLQGVDQFSPLSAADRLKPGRGVIPFGLDVSPPKALKFVAHLYSRSELG